MSPINLQLVREFFELHFFRVMTNWQQESPRAAEADAQLFVENSHPEPVRPLEFLLRLEDIPVLERAVVEIRAWHGDRFYPSVVDSNPILTQFVRGPAQARAAEVFGPQPFVSVLVVSELPTSPEPRARSLERLSGAGLDHVIEFPTILHGLLEKVSAAADYDASPTLAVLRLLKRYRLVRNLQLEFAFRSERTARADASRIDASLPPADEVDIDEEDERTPE